MLKLSLQSTEDESASMSLEKSKTEDKMAMLEKSIMSLHTKTK